MAEVLEMKAAADGKKLCDHVYVDPEDFTILTTALRECKIEYTAGHEVQRKVYHHGGNYHVTKRMVTIHWQKI